jgi:DMSO reductase anchor subunit
MQVGSGVQLENCSAVFVVFRKSDSAVGLCLYCAQTAMCTFVTVLYCCRVDHSMTLIEKLIHQIEKAVQVRPALHCHQHDLKTVRVVLHCVGLCC